MDDMEAMDEKDIEKYTRKMEKGGKIQEYTDRAFKTGFLAIIMAFSIYGGMQAKIEYLSEKINTEEQLQTFLIREKKKLGIEDVPITARFGEKDEGPSIYPSIEGDYVLRLRKGDSVDTLQHELFHAYANERGKRYEGFGLMNELKEELPADIYAATGIRLK